MADMGFLPAVRRLLDLPPRSRQTLLFSATLDGSVDVLVRDYQRNPVRHELQDTENRSTHTFWKVERDQRAEIAAGIIRQSGPTIVFCRTKHGTDALAKKLGRLGIRSEVIHANRTQGHRERALQAFADGHADALVATDVAARGIHVDDVACVVQADLPADRKDYTHRAGRTGRAGRAGKVVTFVCPDQALTARRLQRALGLDLPITSPAIAAVTSTKAVEHARARDRTVQGEHPGTVKWFDSRRGFGFITQHDGSDLFVHHRDLAAASLRALKPGQTVSFEVARGRKGNEAKRVRVLAA
jgi:superfamily II DNA/RNA helicase